MAFFSSKDLPNVRPVADFNFAATKVLDNRINFSRGSGGTYIDNMGVVRYASHNVPRFDHNPTTGESLGLLVEESRTNVAESSEDFGNTSFWNPTSQTITTNVATAPDGNLTADNVVPASGSAAIRYLYFLANPYPMSSSTVYTTSIFVKKNGLRYFAFQTHDNGSGDGHRAGFDLDNGIVVSGTPNNMGSASGVSASIVEFPNGWFRCIITGTTSGSGSTGKTAFSFSSALDSNASVSAITADGSSGGYVWGHQVEAAAFPTSYIPTSGSTVARSEDRAVVKGEKFKKIFDTGFNSFSVLIDYDNLSTDDGDNHGIFAMWGEETDYDNRIELFKSSSSPYHIMTRAIGGGGGVFANAVPVGSDKSAVQKIAFSWSVPDYSNTTSRRWAFSFSGEDVDEIADSTGTSTPALTRLGIGINPTRLDLEAGLTHYKRVAIYNTVLTDEELKGLSAI